MFDMLGQGPANPATDALIPADKKRINPVDPANMSKQVPLDMEWYAENYGKALDEYTKDHLGLIALGAKIKFSRQAFDS